MAQTKDCNKNKVKTAASVLGSKDFSKSQKSEAGRILANHKHNKH